MGCRTEFGLVQGTVYVGPSSFHPVDSPLPRAKADFNKKLRDVPHKPGVYLMRDRLNRIIYVGKARDLRKRVGELLHAFAPPDGGHEDPGAHREHLGFRVPRRQDGAGVPAAGEPFDQGVPAPVQCVVARRQGLPISEGERGRPDPALPVDPDAQGRRGALLRAVRARGGAAGDAEPDAGQVRAALVPSVPAGGVRLQALPRAGHQEMSRAVRGKNLARGLPGARAVGVRVFWRASRGIR